MAARCCPCNGAKAKCIRCVCVKNGLPCISCCPSKLGYCQNVSLVECDSSTTDGEAASCADDDDDSDEDRSRCFAIPSREDETVVNHSLDYDSVDMFDTSRSSSSVPMLPVFTESPPPSFCWGSLDGQSCVSLVGSCYSEAIKWKLNLFKVPTGKVGIVFV